MKIFALLILFASSSAFAWTDSYTCVVKDIADVKDSGADRGLMKHRTDSAYFKVGSIFIIKKTTGEVVGKEISSDGMVSEVLDVGGQSNYYKTLSTHNIKDNFRRILYVQVHDLKGHNTYPLPFQGFNLSEPFSGVCN